MLDKMKKIVLRAFPELTAGLHLDRYARVLAVQDAPDAGAASERFRPRYAVDIEILTPDGARDESFPTYEAVPLPIAASCGMESGLLGLPEPGCLVTIGFAYGRPDHPLIRAVYPLGLSMPPCAPGEMRWQQSPDVAQVADADGNWCRTTPGDITDESLRRFVLAVEASAKIARELREISENSTEKVGGMKRIEALAAIKLLSAGFAELGSADSMRLLAGRDMAITTAQDRREVVGRNHTTEVRGSRTESVGGNRGQTVGGNNDVTVTGSSSETAQAIGKHAETIGHTAGESMSMSAGQTMSLTAPAISINGGSWAGMLGNLQSFMDEVRCALDDLADHVHTGIDQPPDVQGEVHGHADDIESLRGTFEGMK